MHSIEKYVTIADDILSVTLNSTSMCWVPSLSQIYETEMQCNTSNSLVFFLSPTLFPSGQKIFIICSVSSRQTVRLGNKRKRVVVP